MNKEIFEKDNRELLTTIVAWSITMFVVVTILLASNWVFNAGLPMDDILCYSSAVAFVVVIIKFFIDLDSYRICTE